MAAFEGRNLYKTARWRKMRAQQLARKPFCQCPHHKGTDKSARATVVDHTKPHRGDPRLFWDVRNLRSMTKLCHDRFKQSEEKGGTGFLRGCDERGIPLSEDHHWHE